jgi:hypothetical protein
MNNFIPAQDLYALNDQQLADEIGRLDIMYKAYRDALDAAKSEFKVRGIAECHGETFTVAVRSDVRWTLDTKAVKAEMGEDWYTERSKIQAVATVSIKANKGLVAQTVAA